MKSPVVTGADSGDSVRHLLEVFDQVRIINLVDRPDRRREILAQLKAVGGVASNITFYEARRPSSAGEFPSIGARGCFESHLNILREALQRNVSSLLILEDDFDFSRAQLPNARTLLNELMKKDWSLFYGAHLLPPRGRRGLVMLAHDEGVMTTSFIAINGQAVAPIVDFLEAMMERPSGSPDFGPMHVDGAYSVFRKQNPAARTWAAFPRFGRQRSSQSDVTPANTMLHRLLSMGGLANLLRRARNMFGR